MMNTYKSKSILSAALSIVITVLFLFATVTIATFATDPVTVKAEEQTTEKKYVIDDADILTDTEEANLEKMCKEKSDNCKTDLVIITIRKNLDYSALDNYALNILRTQYGYNGTGNDCKATAYVIDMISRADRVVVTGGVTKNDISDSQLDHVREAAEKKLKDDGDYYGGCVKYLKGMELHLNDSFAFKCLIYLPIKLLIAAVVAVVAVLIMMYHAKSKMTVTGNTYAKGHHGDLRSQSDQFINTTVVRRKIETSHGGSGGGGGGGGARSSGGHF